VQIAKLFGAAVIAADVSDEKLELAKQWGADATINVRETPDVAEEVRKLTGGRGVEAAVDYAGEGPSFQCAVDSLAMGGRAVIIGAGEATVTFPSRSLIHGELIVTGSRHSTRAEFIETMEIMAGGLVQPVVGRRVPFTEVESIFDDIKAQKLLG